MILVEFPTPDGGAYPLAAWLSQAESAIRELAAD